MHKQIRVKPTLSPADLERLLRVLARAKINIVAAGGSDLELDGEFAFSVDHESTDRAVALLEQAGYKPYLVDVYHCLMEDKPGELRRCLLEAVRTNLESSRVIKDIAIGVPQDGRVPVQVYTIEVRTSLNTEPPPDDPEAEGTSTATGS